MERFFSKILGKNKLTALIDLARPWNSIIVVLLSILGAIMINLPGLYLILILVIVTLLVYSGSAAVNDLFDVHVDSVNMPFRPLERGSLVAKEVIYFSIVCYALGLLISFFISFVYFLSIILMTVSSMIYSLPPFSFKNKGILGNFNLAFATIFTTLYSGAVLMTNNLIIPYNIIIYAISLTFLFAFFSILKDFKDTGGDKIYNKKTLVLKHGRKAASLLSIIGTLIFFPLTIFIIYNMFKNYLFLVISFILFISLLFIEFKIYKNPTNDMGEKSWSIGRFILLLFVLIMFLF